VVRFVDRRRRDGCVVVVDARRVSRWEEQPLASVSSTHDRPDVAHVPVPNPIGSRAPVATAEWGEHARAFLREGSVARR